MIAYIQNTSPAIHWTNSVGKRLCTRNIIMWTVINHRFWLTWAPNRPFQYIYVTKEKEKAKRININTMQLKQYKLTFRISHIFRIHLIQPKWNISFQIFILYLSLLAGLDIIIVIIIWQMAWIYTQSPFGLLPIRISSVTQNKVYSVSVCASKKIS